MGYDAQGHHESRCPALEGDIEDILHLAKRRNAHLYQADIHLANIVLLQAYRDRGCLALGSLERMRATIDDLAAQCGLKQEAA